VLIAKMKNKKRAFFIYDVFGLIPAPTAQDTSDAHERYKTIISGKSEGIGGDAYYGYQEDLYETVLKNLKHFGIDCEEDNVFFNKRIVTGNNENR
jgi:asparagine synthase (glutamine-hydrolysing)